MNHIIKSDHAFNCPSCGKTIADGEAFNAVSGNLDGQDTEFRCKYCACKKFGHHLIEYLDKSIFPGEINMNNLNKLTSTNQEVK